MIYNGQTIVHNVLYCLSVIINKRDIVNISAVRYANDGHENERCNSINNIPNMILIIQRDQKS